MSNENNLTDSEKEEIEERSSLKGWENFVDGIKGGFEKFQKSLEKQSKKNKELWEENKEKVNIFFKNLKQGYDDKVKQWNADIEKRKLESKEKLEAHKKKIKDDFKNWQEKTQQEWNQGFKEFQKGMLKSSYMFLLYMIPILIIVIVIVFLISKLFSW